METSTVILHPPPHSSPLSSPLPPYTSHPTPPISNPVPPPATPLYFLAGLLLFFCYPYHK